MGRVVATLGGSKISHLRRSCLASIFACVSCLCPAVIPSAAFATQCSSVPVSVTASDVSLSERICDAADRAVELLAGCGLEQSEAVRIEVLDGINLEHPSCAGVFHCSKAKIELVTPRDLAKALGRDHPFLEIPRDAFYDSLVAHEMAHALAYQTRDGPLQGTAETEYIGYAIQLSFLPEDVRTAFLSTRPVAEPVELIALNEVILAFSPAEFAVRAWKHFDAPENGCRFIRRLLDGEVLLSTVR